MNSELKDRIWKERLFALAYASPFLVFILPGIFYGIRAFPDLHAVGYTVLEILFIGTYISIWLLNDTAPVSQRVTPTYVVTLSVLWILATISLYFYEFSTIFNIVYLVPAIMFLTVRPLLSRMLLGYALYAFSAFSGVYFFGEQHVASVIAAGMSVTITFVIVALSRGQLDRERSREIEQVRTKNLSVEEERNRMASDLHDVLGQTLTAINTMSQLSAKLLERGQIERAQETQDRITELSREALHQMRAVVRSRQTLSIPEEVDRAYQLLTAANISVSTSIEDVDFPEHVEDAAAHVIREGAANVVHHALAQHCRITVSKRGVRVTDDGRARNNSRGRGSKNPESSEHPRSGSGIENLKARSEGIGTVTAQSAPDGDGWVLDFALDPAVLESVDKAESSGNREKLSM
ncbi:MAG: histidine kinase [Acidobacteriota bacterium]|nr:histidine kinase [Acidobacteriota bacterium]